MLVVGVTGGLASGKTVVAQMFHRLGAVVLDADKIAHRAIYTHSSCYDKIVRAFGRVILNSNGSINRKKLAAIAFKDKKKQKQLSSIVHPRVIAYIKKKIGEYRKKKTKGPLLKRNRKVHPHRINVVVVDAALLIESGLYKNMDITIVVRSTRQQQIQRALERGRMSYQQAKQRIRFQLPLHKKIKYADYIIDNQKGLKHTEFQVKAFWDKITQNPHG